MGWIYVLAIECLHVIDRFIDLRDQVTQMMLVHKSEAVAHDRTVKRGSRPRSWAAPNALRRRTASLARRLRARMAALSRRP